MQIQLNFDKFELDKPYDCESNFIDIFSDTTDLPSRDRNFCGSVAESVPSEHNIMFLRFFAETKAMKSTFKATFTAYRETEKPNSRWFLFVFKTFFHVRQLFSGCFEDEFDCEDKTCISEDLRCNDVVNCRFRWDEDNCDVSHSILNTFQQSESFSSFYVTRVTKLFPLLSLY